MAKAEQQADGAPDTDIGSIAATLLMKKPEEETPSAKKPNEAPEDDLDAEKAEGVEEQEDASDAGEQEEEDESPTSGTDEEEDETSSDADEDDEGDDADEDDEQQGEDDETDYLDVRDDDLITVMVDDEEQEVSIGDLKRNFSLGRATEQRLQEATELRKTAHAEQTKALEDFAAQTAMFSQVFEGLDDNFFKGIIPPPDEAMRAKNPEVYLRHKDAYDQEQAHITAAKQALADKKKEVEEKRAAALKEYSEKAATVIAKYIPELADPKTSQQTFGAMTQMATAYGYTPKEINSALDPRMFLIMRDLTKYHELLNKTKGRNVVDNKGQKGKKVRRLRSGNTQARQRARAADKQRKKATETARATGKTKDIAATLIVPAPKG